jgi:Ion channel
VSAQEPTPTELVEPSYRYGIVFFLILALLVFEIVAPTGDAARAIATALAGAALIVSIATWRTRTRRLGLLITLSSAAVVLLVIGIAVGIVSSEVTHAVDPLLLIAIPATLIRGLISLIGQRGADLQAIAGALSIYLMLGLLFASVIAFVSDVQSKPYFVQGTNVTDGDRVYYSFTVLTTTGFGDYTAATPVGHALAVLEMLSGQLFLVTVIGVLIGHYIGRRN